MRRTIFVVVSCLLLLGLVLAGCGGTYPAVGGKQVGVWPNADYAALSSVLSRTVIGLNWTAIEYTGTEGLVIPDAWVTEWEGW